MKISQYQQILEKLLMQISTKQITLFNTLTCESMLPAYQAFHEKMEWGNVDVLKDILVHNYGTTLRGNVDIREIEEMKLRLVNATPNTNEFEEGLASYALDVCSAFDGSLDFLKNSKVESSINVAVNALSMVDMFVQEKEDLDPNDSDLEKLIDDDEYMKREIERQKLSLSVLTRIEQWTKKEIEEFRIKFGQPMIDVTRLPY